VDAREAFRVSDAGLTPTLLWLADGASVEETHISAVAQPGLNIKPYLCMCTIHLFHSLYV